MKARARGRTPDPAQAGPPPSRPDIFDPPPLDSAKAAFIRAKDGYLIVREHEDDSAPGLAGR